jgi:DNA anti-recombination protein RmuC
VSGCKVHVLNTRYLPNERLSIRADYQTAWIAQSRILEQITINQQAEQQSRLDLAQKLDRVATNQQAEQQLRLNLAQKLDRIATNQEALQQTVQQNSTVISAIRKQLEDSVSDLISTIGYAFNHMEEMLIRAFGQSGNGHQERGLPLLTTGFLQPRLFTVTNLDNKCIKRIVIKPIY